MAGIGFKLKKMFVEGNYVSNVAGYFYSAVVIAGPMIICMGIILLAKAYMTYLGGTYLQVEYLTATIVYNFVFSMILTGGAAFITSRYVSDRLFANDLDDVLHSYYAMQAIVAVACSAVALAFLVFTPQDLLNKLLAYLLFVALSGIWLDMVYISAFKEHFRILIAFGTSFLIIVALGLALSQFPGIPLATAMLLAITAGFGVLHGMLTVNIRRYFRQSRRPFSRHSILAYIKKHGLLFLAGTLLTASPYVHNFVFWFSPDRSSVADTYIYCPNYDIPGFYAILTIIPTIVMFVVSMETSFYTKYRNYYYLILNEGITYEIKLAKKEMEETLFAQLSRMMQIQLLFSFVAIVGGIYLLSAIGFIASFVSCFTALALGSYTYVFLDTVVLILLYFDDIRGATFFTSLYFCLNIILSIISLQLGTDFYGYGYFVSGLLCLTGGLMRLFFYVKNIHYFTYCKQPLMIGAPKGGDQPQTP